MRVVFDTNVALSALLFTSGRLSWLRQAWQDKHCVPLISRATVTELLRVLSYPKFKLTQAEQEALLADYLPYCESVPLSEPPPAIPGCRDPFDAPFLQLALAAQADYLVTGDSDLLVLANAFAIPVITPETLRERLSINFRP